MAVGLTIWPCFTKLNKNKHYQMLDLLEPLASSKFMRRSRQAHKYYGHNLCGGMVGFLSLIFSLTTQAMLATLIKTSKELAFKMTTVQMAAWKPSESFNLPENLSLQ